MDKVKGLAKSGWHPDSGEKGFRNQVSAVLGHKSDSDRPVRDATPLSHLRDPSSFAPPPKRIDSGVLPPPALSSPSPSSSQQYQDHQPQNGHQQQHEYGVAAAPPAPPRPYRADTTGLSTANLPPPPRRRDGADGVPVAISPPPPYTPMTGAAAGKPPPPSLPPRLPPRESKSSSNTPPRLPTPGAPNRQTGILNQDSIDRLGSAGLLVPGLGIGGGSSKPMLPPPRSAGTSPRPSAAVSGLSPPPPPPSSSSVNELQARFSTFGVGRSSTNEGTAAPQAMPPSQGTTWKQKQAALKTMSDIKKDPGSVSFSDMKSAASTANNFRQRHGEQVAAGVAKANSLDTKYGVSAKYGGYLDKRNDGPNGGAATTASTDSGRVQSQLSNIGAAAGLLGKKKPPPPPPPKKKGILGSETSNQAEDEPPPIPMSTRPF